MGADADRTALSYRLSDTSKGSFHQFFTKLLAQCDVMAHMLPMNNILITKNEAASRCNVSRRTLERWVSAGLLPTVKFIRAVRIDARDLEDFIGKFRRGGDRRTA